MEIAGISSMATRQILAALTKRYEERTGQSVAIQAMGGVDAARAVREGAETDIVILAADVMARLEQEGLLASGSTLGIARSGMAIAVPSGAPHPDIASADAVRRAVAAARRVGYSTGPSGDHLLRLCDAWGLGQAEGQGDPGRLVKAPPGVPVASLVASGEADLGFQQLSELMHVPGIEIVGSLPSEIQAVTIFAAGVASTSRHPREASALISFLASEDGADVKRQHGMEPV
ncbi:MAG: substrate-binding domain-containing protein [Beijerinckiaceae bacterium]|nr:substrate-binding domain-containing protein [Beijerinckiaceae bacterium]